MKKLILLNSGFVWWLLWVLQWLAGLACLYVLIWSRGLFFFFVTAGLSWLSYIGRVYLKKMNIAEFEKYYNVSEEVAPGLDGQTRRRIRRKNQNDKELNDLKNGIL